MDQWHYVYYSYEDWGRGYIGKRSSKVPPDQDVYFGSFKDKNFRPTNKIILQIFDTSQEALNAEIALHSFFNVDKNPHFANQAKQTSTKFCWHGSLSQKPSPQQEFLRRHKIAEKQNSLSNNYFYHLISPSGTIHVTINLREFCRDHGLNRRNLQKVVAGERCHSHGWKIQRINLKP